MTVLQSLLRLNKPYSDESLSGFILRLAETNHYDSSTWIFSLAGLSQYNFNANLLTPQKADFSALSQLTGVVEEILWSMAFPTYDEDGESKAEVFGRKVSSYNLQKSISKVCPLCLADAPYCRKAWNVLFITACPFHNCALIDECPQCSKRITWARGSVTKCKRCKFDWRSFTPATLESYEIALTSHIYSLCNLYVPKEVLISIVELTDSVLNLDLEQLNKLIFFLAGQFNFDTTRKFLTITQKNRELHSLTVRAFNLFGNWPVNFYHFLDWRRTASSKTKLSTGITKDFGGFYKKLYTNFSGESYAFIQEAFEAYLAQNWDGGYFNSKLGRIKGTVEYEKKYISGAEAAHTLEVREEWIVKLIQQERLDGVIKTMGKRRLILVNAKSLLSLKDEFKNALALKEAAKILGVGEKAVIDLFDYRCLQALRGPRHDGYTQWLVSLNSISTLLNLLSSQISTNSIQEPTISFSNALRRLTGLNYTTGRLVRLALDCVIRPQVEAKGLVGLKKYLFLEKDIDELIKQSLAAQKEQWLTVVDIAQLLGVKQEVASFWIDQGFILCEKQIHQYRCRRRVLRSSLDIFEQTYIPAVQLAKLMNTSAKNSVHKLMIQKIMPVSGPKVDGGRQYLFCRKDVLALLHS